ncbi:MBL fold metallo-hydrolase [Flammeovirgaceae bacterium SG7u.111]|nr:MBL fold metallo-hydrolase [Flammeovirgaceae bacterium SG7u.132]WPO34202.1 MBL fold metallo-hydrolase [Flammeovirgaceae bacterium SG7u.111]
MKQFGGKINQELKESYANSPNWKNGKFENLEETNMDINFQTLPKLLYKQFFQTEGRAPKEKLTVAGFNKEEFLSESEEAKFIWYGHSVVLMRVSGKTLLIDPMLGGDAAPIAPFPSKRFSENTLDIIEDFPEIDLVLLTHDHYDHLDYASILKLKGKTKQYFVAMGVKRHLVKWGISPDTITEFDWWDNDTLDDISITFTPTRHFSGRGLTDRAKSLWGGWAFKTEKENIYFSGDSGYGEHFKEVGEKLGPFDFGFMECGQYNENWHQIHMYPEESIQAALEAKVKKALPVHWAGFTLAQHSWKEPVERFVVEAQKQKLEISTPQLGSLFSRSDKQNLEWWKEIG